MGGMDCVELAKSCIELEAQALLGMRERVGEDFRRGIALMLDVLRDKGKIVTTGVGKSLLIAQKISATLSSTGSPSVTLHPSQAAHGDLGILCAQDALLALSYSGESDELLAILPLVKRTGVRIVALTGNLSSTLARASEVALDASVPREACPFNMAPTCSTTAALAMGDALALALLDAQGFRREDYAKLHPGGAIGRTLLLSVDDIMRKAHDLAGLPGTAPVRDAIAAMTRARAGSAVIVDTQGRLVGIFTDGDLRRSLAEHPQALDEPVASFMTASPVAVQSGELAVNALAIFEKHKIDDLPVVDEARRWVGTIDVQDLPKLKIV
jgi:arabinose-5-phosphate isomerase